MSDEAAVRDYPSAGLKPLLRPSWSTHGGHAPLPPLRCGPTNLSNSAASASKWGPDEVLIDKSLSLLAAAQSAGNINAEDLVKMASEWGFDFQPSVKKEPQAPSVTHSDPIGATAMPRRGLLHQASLPEACSPAGLQSLPLGRPILLPEVAVRNPLHVTDLGGEMAPALAGLTRDAAGTHIQGEAVGEEQRPGVDASGGDGIYEQLTWLQRMDKSSRTDKVSGEKQRVEEREDGAECRPAKRLKKRSEVERERRERIR